MTIRAVLNSVKGELIVKGSNYLSWEDRQNVIKRSENYHGVIITETLDLTFTGEAYEYLLDLDNTYDVAAECSIKLQLYQGINDWQDDFIGLIDFTTKKQSNNGAKKITYSAYSDDFSNKILEREKIKIPYDRLTTLDNGVITPFTNEYTEVDIIGMPIADNGITSTFPNDLDETFSSYKSDGSTRNAIFAIDNEITNPSYQDVSKRTYGGSELPFSLITTDCFYYAKVDSSISINYSIDYLWREYDNIINPNNGDLKIYLYKLIFNELGVIQSYSILDSELYSFTSLKSGTITSGTFSGSQSLELNQYEGLCFYAYQVAVGADAGSKKIELRIDNTSTLTSNYSQLAPPTPCNFVPPIQAWKRTIEGITGVADAVLSDFMTNGLASEIWLTNGKLMRQFPTGYKQEDNTTVAQLKFSVIDLFDNDNAVYNIGMGVEYDGTKQNVRVETKDYFYKSEVILTIEKGQIEEKTFEKERNLEYYYNIINVGYEYPQPESAGTLEDYNSLTKLSSPVLNDNEYNAVSQYCGAGYVMEDIRRKKYDPTGYSEGETADTQYDNTNFYFSIYNTGVSYIQRTTQGFSVVNGIENITTPINLIRTPARIAKDHGWWINTGFKGYTGDTLKYNESKITTDLATRLDSESQLVKENEDININDLDTALFSGNTVRFNAPVGTATFNLLKDNPYKMIKYWDMLKEDYGYGWIKQVSTSPIDKATNWEIIEALSFNEEGGYRLTQDGGIRLLEDGGRRLVSD